MAEAALRQHDNAFDETGKKAKVIKIYKTEMSDDELYALVMQYGTWHYKKLRYQYDYHVDKGDVIGEIAVKACEAREKYNALPKKTANLKTYLIKAFSTRMTDYRKYLHIRQRKYPMARIIEC